MHDHGLTPRIYVASLADYNAGRLHGVWIDAAQDVDDIQDAINTMLAESREPIAEEWAIHDYDDMPSSLGENPDLATVSAMAEAIKEHGEIAIKLVDGAYCDPADVGEYLENNYHGDWDSLEEYAADHLDQTGEVDQLPEHLRGYFDYESFARDLELGGDVFTIELDGRTHVFSNR